MRYLSDYQAEDEFIMDFESITEEEDKERALFQEKIANKHKQEPIGITGFMPKRKDFDIEFDNDAELLLAEMEFNGQLLYFLIHF